MKHTAVAKQFPTMASTRVMLALTLALIPGISALVTNAETSVGQIRDTLQNLLRSVEDSGHEAEDLYTERQEWCTASLHNFNANASAEQNNLVNLREELDEHEAAVEEAVGTVQQVQADIKLVEHTIKQTEELLKVRQKAEKKEVENEEKALKALSSKSGEADADQMRKKLVQTRKNMKKQFEADSHLLNALIHNKRQGLASLKGQLQVALPALSQLQAKVAETTQRIEQKTDSVAASSEFAAALRKSCASSSNRADSQADSRVSEATNVEAALQALEQLSAELHNQATAPAVSDDQDPQDSQANSEVSFVQTRSRSRSQSGVATEEDLADLFSDDGDDNAASPLKKDESLVADGAMVGRQYRSDMPQMQIPVYNSPKVSLPPLKSLLAQLKSTVKTTNAKHQAWCHEEREQSELTLRLSEDAASQLGSELEAHKDAEAELSQDLENLNATSNAIRKMAEEMKASARKEKAFLSSKSKDQELATKILAQASTIMQEVGESHPTRTGNRKVLTALGQATWAFKQQLKSAGRYANEVEKTTLVLAQKASSATAVLLREQQGTRYARDEHTAQRLKTSDAKDETDAQLKEAHETLKTLSQTCRSDALEAVLEERKAEIQGLEDAQAVFRGTSVSNNIPVVRQLRGITALKKKTAHHRELTPMERAAQEMGVNVDTSDE